VAVCGVRRRGDRSRIGVLSLLAVALAAVVGLTAADIAGAATAKTIVKTTQGIVKGKVVTSDGNPAYTTFFGIRYGQDTGGANRWLPPKPAKWSGVFDATEFGPIAPQSLINGYGDPDPAKMNEDCLRVNIWTPAADGKKRPVIVYLHGGGFTLGDPRGEYYSGKRFAQDGIVFVNLSYRIGPWGFMNVGMLEGAPAKYRNAGNLGLLDQRLALKFIKKNIARFGGDPNNITLAGQSAGAWSTAIHMALPQSNKLFNKAICMSGAPQVGDLQWSRKVAVETMKAAGVPAPFDEAMKLTIEQLNDAQDKLYYTYDYNWWCMLYRPILDGIVIKQDPNKSIRQGQGRNIALMTGTTADEMRYWDYWVDWRKPADSYGPAVTATIPTLCDPGAGDPAWQTQTYERMVKNAVAQTGKTPEEIEAAYLASHPGDTPNDALWAMLNDLTFRIPVVRLVENRLSAPGHKDNNYMYVFDWDSQLYLQPKHDPVKGLWAKAYHAVEVGFAFAIPDQWTYAPWKEYAPYEAGHQGEAGYGTFYPTKVWPDQVVDQVHRSFINFAVSGDPNNRYMPKWKTYTKSRRTTAVFDTQPSIVKDWCRADRLLWAGVKGDPLYECPTAVALWPDGARSTVSKAITNVVNPVPRLTDGTAVRADMLATD